MTDYEIGKMLIDSNAQNGIDAYKKGRTDAIDEFEKYAQKWADRQVCIGRKVVKLVVNELIDSAKELKEQK